MFIIFYSKTASFFIYSLKFQKNAWKINFPCFLRLIRNLVFVIAEGIFAFVEKKIYNIFVRENFSQLIFFMLHSNNSLNVNDASSRRNMNINSFLKKSKKLREKKNMQSALEKLSLEKRRKFLRHVTFVPVVKFYISTCTKKAVIFHSSCYLKALLFLMDYFESVCMSVNFLRKVLIQSFVVDLGS